MLFERTIVNNDNNNDNEWVTFYRSKSIKTKGKNNKRKFLQEDVQQY